MQNRWKGNGQERIQWHSTCCPSHQWQGDHVPGIFRAGPEKNTPSPEVRKYFPKPEISQNRAKCLQVMANFTIFNFHWRNEWQNLYQNFGFGVRCNVLGWIFALVRKIFLQRWSPRNRERNTHAMNDTKYNERKAKYIGTVITCLLQ